MVASTTKLDLFNAQPLRIEDALAYYDALPTVDVDFMLGRWKGTEIKTGHPMDGALQVAGWYGKLFLNAENVHPLLFYGNNQHLYSVNPGRIPMNFTFLPFDMLPDLSGLLWFLRPLIGTRRARARLRMVEYRGLTSAAMVYDQLAIIDCFRKIDDHTVLGAMDQKGFAQPYFFILERDETPVSIAIKE